MKLKAYVCAFLLSFAVVTSQPISEARSKSESKVLNALLTFHPHWISRSVTSHDLAGGNDDGGGFGNPMEGKYHVLFHGKGEGRINRIWMTTDLRGDAPKKNWKELVIIIDGHTLFKGLAVDFFSGRGDWKYPLVLDSKQASGGFLSYVPFAYHRDAKILLYGNPHYYQVTYQEGPGSSVGPSAEETSRFLAQRWWAHIPAEHATQVTLRPGERVVVAEGVKLITQLAVRAEELHALEDLKIVVNNQKPAPLGFFFGLGVTEANDEESGWASVKSATHYVDQQTHLMMTRLPLPLQQGDSILIENDGEHESKINLAYDDANQGPPAGVRLNATYTEQWAPGTNVSMTFFKSPKPLQFVSLVEEIRKGRSDNAYLEGDELIRTDKMEYPSIIGTGTEDYFNGGWYFSGPHTNPMSGEPRYFDDSGSPEHSLYREHVLDPIVSRSDFRFGFEAGEVGAYNPVYYSTLAFAYEFNGSGVVARSQASALDIKNENLVSAKATVILDAEASELARDVTVNLNKKISRLAFVCPKESFTSVLLTRTYEAKIPEQEAIIKIQGKRVGSFYESYANPLRSLAQDARALAVGSGACVNGELAVDIINKNPKGFSEINYEAAFLK